MPAGVLAGVLSGMLFEALLKVLLEMLASVLLAAGCLLTRASLTLWTEGRILSKQGLKCCVKSNCDQDYVK